MKFKTRIRMQGLAGLGVALLLASSAYAQQEMDPTPFDDGPYVAPMAQPVPSTSAANAAPAQSNSANVPQTSFGTTSLSQAAAVSSPAEEISLTGLLACAACVLLYEIAKARSQNQAARLARSSSLPRGASTL
jgi:hypothetical protein